MVDSVVVVGGGQAGAALVARLRNDGFAGAVTLIGDEPVPPYQRPPLPAFMASMRSNWLPQPR
jgi:3-phenylpropionate/trans-cinnamate dioxygenase ferredoxin reductase subunit